ncbi:MAG: hypothetical protein M1818_005025 [Claussenomyces sp. TS43310]|nr:MAG: hypothetical protein M1818_005025 [Claussenomyces sp. TS43310]
MEELRDSINDLRRPNFESRHYIPERALYRILTETSIRDVLKDCEAVQPYEIHDLVKVILSGARKIFSILVLNNHVKYVKKFVEIDQLQALPLDHRLPLGLEKLKMLLSESHARIFHEKQWEFTSPTFSESVLRRQLDDEIILPFVSETSIGKGGFGVVHEIELDVEQNLYPQTYQKLVRKELLSHTDDYQNELGNLSSLKLLKNPNLMHLLGSYTHRKKHNFIFPKARGGDLAAFFKNERPTQFREDDSLILALSRLASAVGEVHEFLVTDLLLASIGCHHDIKPSNILVDDDQFILADFGLARFKDFSQASETMFKIGQGYCLAPECQELGDDFDRHIIHRSSDIWSFGCVIADLITYMLHGPAGIIKFKQQRRFQVATNVYYYFHKGSEANIGVERWLHELESRSSRPVVMLIELTRKMLSIEPELRPTARQVAADIRFIALYAIADKVSHSFQMLVGHVFQQEASIEPEIEQGRFTSWTWAVGIIPEGEQMANLSPRTDLEFNDFQSAVELLRTLQQELESIQNQSPNTGKRILMPLRHLNTSLMNLLPPPLQRRAREYLERQLLHTNSPERLEKIEHGQSSETIQLLAGIRKLTMRAPAPFNAVPRTMEMKNKPDIGAGELGHHRIGDMQTGDNERLQVLIEYKLYEDPLLRERLFDRIEGIARLSHSIADPQKLRLLHCRGYFHDENRYAFGLVYEYPTIITSNHPQTPLGVTCLRSLLESARREHQPLLRDRFKLAYNFASAIGNFHKVGWFHKGITSSNLAFFHGPDKLFADSFANPYIIGFRHSRPNEVATFTEGISPSADVEDRCYQHPQYLRDNVLFSFTHEYYSLGIVLLEIGLWKPLMKTGKFAHLPPEDLHARVLASVVPRLGQSMGIVYRDAVMALLSWDRGQEAGARGEEDAQMTQLAFEAKVLNKLHGLSEMEI